MKRTLKIALMVLSVLAIAAWVGLRVYLHSSGIAAKVTAPLSALYGGPVTIEKVDIGLTGTTVRGAEFFEPNGDTAEATPWLKVRAVTINVPLWDLARSNVAPTHARVHGADVCSAFLTRVTYLRGFPRKRSQRSNPGTAFRRSRLNKQTSPCANKAAATSW